MSSGELIYTVLFVTAALGGAVAIVAGLVFGVHFEPRVRRIASSWLPVLLLFGFAASTLVSGRNASLYGLGGAFGDIGPGRGVWILRISTALAVGGSLLLVAAAVLRRASTQAAAKPLFFAFLGYFFFAYVFSGLLGTELAISHKTFYPLAVVCALYFTCDQNYEDLIRKVRDSLLLFLLVGLALIPVMPDLVLQKGYSGFVPGLTFRYWGLASHANNIGPLAIAFFLLMWWHPYRLRALTALAVAVSSVTLLLAQSKTAFVAAIFVVMFFAVRWWFLAVFHNKSGRTGSAIAIGFGMLLITAVLVAAVADVYSYPLEYLLGKIQGQGTMFTGREQIWSITVAEWERNPLFGYGPDLWGDAFSARYGYLGVASNAHNQLFDTLGAAGVFGVISLAIYLAMLCYYAVLLVGPSKGASVALVAFLLIRCITEVPLKTINITTSDFFMQALILGIFMRAAMANADVTALPRARILNLSGGAV